MLILGRLGHFTCGLGRVKKTGPMSNSGIWEKVRAGNCTGRKSPTLAPNIFRLYHWSAVTKHAVITKRVYAKGP